MDTQQPLCYITLSTAQWIDFSPALLKANAHFQAEGLQKKAGKTEQTSIVPFLIDQFCDCVCDSMVVGIMASSQSSNVASIMGIDDVLCHVFVV